MIKGVGIMEAISAAADVASGAAARNPAQVAGGAATGGAFLSGAATGLLKNVRSIFDAQKQANSFRILITVKWEECVRISCWVILKKNVCRDKEGKYECKPRIKNHKHSMNKKEYKGVILKNPHRMNKILIDCKERASEELCKDAKKGKCKDG